MDIEGVYSFRIQDFRSSTLIPYVQDNVEVRGHHNTSMTIRVLTTFCRFQYILGTLKKVLECIDVPNLMIDIARIIMFSASLVPDAAAVIFQVSKPASFASSLFGKVI